MPQSKIKIIKSSTSSAQSKELPLEQLIELERVGVLTLDKKGNPIINIDKSSSQTNTIFDGHKTHELSLEQLLELQRVGILSIYPKRK